MARCPSLRHPGMRWMNSDSETLGNEITLLRMLKNAGKIPFKAHKLTKLFENWQKMVEIVSICEKILVWGVVCPQAPNISSSVF